MLFHIKYFFWNLDFWIVGKIDVPFVQFFNNTMFLSFYKAFVFLNFFYSLHLSNILFIYNQLDMFGNNMV